MAIVLDLLAQRIHTPELVMMHADDQYEFLITKAITAQPLSDHVAQGLPVVGLYLEAITQLQAIAVHDCPFDALIDMRLKEVAYMLQHGLTAQDFDPTEAKVKHLGIENAEALLNFLKQQPMQQEMVFSHGDLTDSNVFVDDKEQLYFLDLGRAGIADRWLDIAFIEQGLRDDRSETEADAFLQGLGYLDRANKREFFIQMDELF